ncbi:MULTISPECIES: MarR family winged helix-turn-helix transcriptional regulator [Carnobacterium]|uniref:MarR family winged helix-turn-helix transcriptional regulator n=1 Tax=Carnobacterium TaxID=2747 RepID=UPI00288D054D|nr:MULTISPECIES: MarR family winged helix-turn-helix transcriptional regulator [Carnobacterium]MDT1938851.1 MarR family winged helix-turn-helix transcriptional regulator [Carnobacterium divergens]MDT1941289.1 MarR family winged helix-turn-helix transcriptional regulator [Carnobacterium divergens]MDT1947087.1 MarR family winged helix-turn-helix transcriptional regulator [Carnobacterium divergens]MDT1949525.1 MarR family winged helix-turn-helix transcriptional regulator [Carnobacterium divergens]
MPNQSQNNEIKAQLEDFHTLYKQFKTNVLKKHILTKSSLSLLNHLDSNPKTIKELSHDTNLDKSTLSRQVDTLIKKNLAMEIEHLDRRLRTVQISDYGQELQKQIHQQLDEKWDTLFQLWSNEEKQLLMVLLGRMNRSFQLN